MPLLNNENIVTCIQRPPIGKWNQAAVCEDTPNQIWVILDWVPRNESDLRWRGYEMVILDIPMLYEGYVVAWVIQRGHFWHIRCNGTDANLVSIWLTKEEAIWNMKEIFWRMVIKGSNNRSVIRKT